MSIIGYIKKRYSAYLCRTGRHDHERVCPIGEAGIGKIAWVCSRCGKENRFTWALECVVYNMPSSPIEILKPMPEEDEILKDVPFIEAV